jgi:enoyl-CoA hydratase/carnithine racemase
VPSLDRDGDVFVLNLGDDENRFNPDWLSAIDGLLDEVVGAPAPRALVTTASGKFFSNGLDLDWLAANQGEVQSYVIQVQTLLARFLTLEVPTVAAIQGHAFAAGAMLTVAHDHRVMRGDRGFWCLPEIDIHIPFTPGMTALIMSKLVRQTRHEAMTTGKRYGGEEALAKGIVEQIGGEDEVVAKALEWAGGLVAKDGATLGAIKRRMYGDVVTALVDPDANSFGS